MPKRKITVTVDEDLIEAVQSGTEPLSSVVNAALSHEVERRARAMALQRQLDRWDAQFGPVSDEATEAARQAFRDLDGLEVETDRSSANREPAA